jgi:hypothetical protein
MHHFMYVYGHSDSLTARALATTIRPWRVQIHQKDTDQALSPSLDDRTWVNLP